MPEPTTSNLGQILEEAGPTIEAALAEAERELGELNARRQDLEDLITRARAALGAIETGPRAVAAASIAARVRLTLHEALRLILTENGNQWMTVHELANEINHRSLYEKRDHSQVEASQIHARANKYPSMFEKDGSRLRLRAP